MNLPEAELFPELQTLLSDGEEVALKIFLRLVRPEDIAGNTSLQSSTTTVRRLALDTLPRGQFMRHIAREISVALLMGTICGMIAATLAVVFGNDPVIGFALGCAMAMGMSAASMLGAAMPLGLDRMGIDPAVSSGPLVSTINDSLALALYFSVATGILYWMG